METYRNLFRVSLMFNLWRVNAENVPRFVFFHLFKFNIKLSTIIIVYCVYISNMERKYYVREFVRFESVVFTQAFR